MHASHWNDMAVAPHVLAHTCVLDAVPSHACTGILASLRQFKQRMHSSPHRLRGQLDTRPSSPDAEASFRSPQPSAPTSPATPQAVHFQSPICEASPAGRGLSPSGGRSPLVSPATLGAHATNGMTPARLRSLTYPQALQRPCPASPPPVVSPGSPLADNLYVFVLTGA